MSVTDMSLPWYRQVNRDQWHAFLAAFLGWAVDGFDGMIMTFVIIDIQRSFTDRCRAGGMRWAAVTMLMRLIGVDRMPARRQTDGAGRSR